MTTRKIGYDYEISDEFWKKIEPLLPPPKPKKKSGRTRKDDRKIMSAIFISFALASNGKRCQGLMEHQALYMTGFRNGKKQGYLKNCGKLVCWSII